MSNYFIHVLNFINYRKIEIIKGIHFKVDKSFAAPTYPHNHYIALDDCFNCHNASCKTGNRMNSSLKLDIDVGFVTRKLARKKKRGENEPILSANPFRRRVG